MATFYSTITDAQADLIRNAPLFFVATVTPDLNEGPNGVGPINMSPKGGVPLHILSPKRVAYLDYVGSGNETARHVGQGSPITIMVCSFEAENAAIVRLYGTATVTPVEQSPLAELLLQQPAQDLKSRPRHVIDIAVESTMTSCGYGVPVMTLVRERQTTDRMRRYKSA